MLWLKGGFGRLERRAKDGDPERTDKLKVPAVALNQGPEAGFAAIIMSPALVSLRKEGRSRHTPD